MDLYALLEHEMIKALGCTEPAAVALAGARAKEALGRFPEKITIKCSNNIIKNVQGVVIPKTENLRGIDVACLLGCLAGKSTYGLEVLKDVKKTDLTRLKQLLKQKICEVQPLPSQDNLHIICEVQAGHDTAEVEIYQTHTNIVAVKKNQRPLPCQIAQQTTKPPRSKLPKLTFTSIYEFANSADLKRLKPLLKLAKQCNHAIATEGLKHCYGACVGRTLLKHDPKSLRTKIKAYAAAGSDARMSGCIMPVIINSGSGNQGMLLFSTIYQYAKQLKAPQEKLERALVLANLLGIWQKSGIGKLSAFCGAVSAAAAAAGGITYLRDGSPDQIAAALTNVLAAIGGIFCDGAKPSCALKIATAVDCALTASDMAMQNHTFHAGEGIVKDDVEKTVARVARIAKHAMKQTDKQILKIMLEP